MGRILVIEDENHVRGSIVDLLEAKGYEVMEASCGQDAFEAVKKQIPDLVLSDIMMPGINGYDVLREFQQNKKTASVPFIFLTAKSDISDMREGMNYGADDYITKPFKAKELLNAIEIRLKKRKMAEEKLENLRLNITRYVPHEMRTPLVAMLGFSQMILDDYYHLSSDEIYDMVDKIRIGSKRLHKTVEKFITFSEIECLLNNAEEAARLRVEYTMDADRVMKSMIREKLNEYGRTDDLSVSLEPGTLLISEQYLKTLLEELVENACKFSASEQPVEVSGQRDGRYYRLVFIDYGKGMTREQISEIDAFVQFNRNHFQQNGNGLGLIIVKKIAELFNGRVTIESEMNMYTKITVELPAA